MPMNRGKSMKVDLTAENIRQRKRIIQTKSQNTGTKIDLLFIMDSKNLSTIYVISR